MKDVSKSPVWNVVQVGNNVRKPPKQQKTTITSHFLKFERKMTKLQALKRDASNKMKSKGKQRKLKINENAIKIKKRDNARLRRATIKEFKQDLYEEHKKRERERYHRRVAEGKIKPVNQMSDKDRRRVRKTRRESNKRYYAKRKQREMEEAQSTPTAVCEPIPTDVMTFERIEVKCEQDDIRDLDEANISKFNEELSSEGEAFNGVTANNHCLRIKKDPDEMHFNCLPSEEGFHHGLSNGWDNISSENFIANSKQPDEQVIGVKNVTQGDWIAVKHGLLWYPGVVKEISDVNVTVDFMIRRNESDHLYMWSPDVDKLVVQKSEILYKLKTPPIPVDRHNFDLLEADLIEKIFREAQIC